MRIEDVTARVGITDFAQDALGDVVFVQLPTLGSVVGSGETVSEVESTKSVSDIYSPVAGTITAVNAQLDGDPSLLNSDPLGSGWIFELAIAPDVDVSHLIDEGEYQRFVKESPDVTVLPEMRTSKCLGCLLLQFVRSSTRSTR